MRFHVMARTYNTYGGHSSLSLISDFLLWDAGEFGPAISELNVTFHFPHTGHALPTLEQLYDNYHKYRDTLPKVVFRRKRGQASIDIASELIDGRDWGMRRGLSLHLFNAGVAETVASLNLLKKRLTAKDDFQLEAFLAHCEQAQSRLPCTGQELATFSEECKKRQTATYAAMSPWERLEIDWTDYHPDARNVLDDPFFWECGDDFAPHGNDTGSDLLADYRKWFRRNPNGDPVMFYRDLIRRWGFSAEPKDEIDQTVMDEAAIALAFAEFKLRADCRPSVAALVRDAVQRQRQQAISAIDWSHREQRLKSLDAIEAKLPIGDN